MDENLGTILIVDDDPATCHGLETLLADKGYRVIAVDNGKAGLVKAAEVLPDLVLLDFEMSGMDGLEVCKQARADPLLAEVPIVMMIPQGDRDGRLRSLEAGADDYVSIPVDGPELLARVKAMTRLNRYRQVLRTQEVRHEREELYRALLDTMVQGVLCCDADGKVVFANPAAQRILGLTLDQMQGQTHIAPHWQAIDRDGLDLPETLPAIAALRSGEEARDVVMGIFDSLREEFRWVEVNTTLLSRPGEDRVCGACTVFEDVTERVRVEAALRQSEQKFRNVVAQASDGVVLTDERGNITEWNRSQERLTGLKRDEVIGFPFWEVHLRLIPEGRHDEVFREMIRVSQQEFFQTGQAPWLNQPVEYDIVHPDGTRRVIQAVAFPVRTEAGFILGTVTRDVTEQIRMQEESQRRNRELAALNEISQIVTSTLDLGEALTLITTHTSRLMNTQATSVLLYDEERGDLYFAAGSGLGADFVVGRRLSLGQGIGGWVVEHDEPVLVPDVSQDSRWFDDFDKGGGFTTRSLLCVPLRGKRRVIGALETINKEGGFAQDDLHLLTALATPVATAIENARLFEEVRVARENLQALSRRLVEVQEAERGYIARELHDETGQALSSLLLNLSLLEQMEECPKEARDRLARMESMVDGMLENLHRLAMNLRPAALDHLGLVPALGQYVEAIGQQHGIATQFETVGLGSGRLPPEVETAIYRIVQEALTNVLRHAQATRVDVLLERRGDQVVAIVEDNGVGFDAEAAQRSGRLGLLGMRERAEMLNGRLMIESAPGAGTTVFVEVPYAYPHPDRR